MKNKNINKSGKTYYKIKINKNFMNNRTTLNNNANKNKTKMNIIKIHESHHKMKKNNRNQLIKNNNKQCNKWILKILTNFNKNNQIKIMITMKIRNLKRIIMINLNKVKTIMKIIMEKTLKIDYIILIWFEI